MNAAPGLTLVYNRFPPVHIFRSIAESCPNVPPIPHRGCYGEPARRRTGFALRRQARIPPAESHGVRSDPVGMLPEVAHPPGSTTGRRRSLPRPDVAADFRTTVDRCAW